MSNYQLPLPPPRQRSSRSRSHWPLIIGIGVFLVLTCLIGYLALVLSEPDDGITIFGKKVAVVEIFGTIFDSEDWVKVIEDCAESDSIAAVVLHIDSPGGAITPTQEIYEATKKITKAGKPVVAYMGSVAASGGYYAACAADEIFAMPGTLTGSIGVYMQLVNASDLLSRLGVEFDTVKKGAFKTAGDFSRSMKPSERGMFQAVVDDYYKQFLEAVAESRTRNRVSLARGWNESLPGGAVPDGTGTAALGGILYPSPAWASTGMSVSAAAMIASASTPTGEKEVTKSETEEEEVTKGVAGTAPSKAEPAKEELAKMFAEGLSEDSIQSRVAALAEGRIYTGRQAMTVGLVDKIGTLDDAVERAGEKAGLGKKPKKVTKTKKESHGLFGIKLDASLFKGSRFLYLCPFGM
jgi:protease-4